MRHDLLPLPIAPGPPGVREAARTRVLVAATGLAQARLARLLPTVHAAVALSAVAPAAQQHLALARRTRERPPWLVHATPGPNSRHRPLRSEPPRALRGRLCSSVGRVPSDGAILRPHCVLCTVGRGGLNNWLGRLGRRARSDSLRRHRSTAQPAARARPPSASVPGRTGHLRRLPGAPAQAHVGHSSHATAAGLSTPAVGRRLRRTDRPPRWASRVRRGQLPSAWAQCHQIRRRSASLTLS